MCDCLLPINFVLFSFQMSKAKLYQNKLLSLRKDMMALHDKSAKLKVYGCTGILTYMYISFCCQ